ncbi:hypothetical protein [Moorena sp. SIO3I8]|uniref:hypothetical protein n=1 Tax=Moorena sp. SIO3I8 TaxID=2607833 RepID=UPI0013C13B45|nr:hypothetical protein [Moorena sp. SIO3I8]NEO05169.1 hypothetical protein [Moorena sp. SIO3I8]
MSNKTLNLFYLLLFASYLLPIPARNGLQPIYKTGFYVAQAQASMWHRLLACDLTNAYLLS